MSHTPGPWTVRKSRADSTYTHIGSKTNDSVACTKSEADARLIAAAPCMLKALRAFVKAEDEWRKQKGGMPEGFFDDALSDAYKLAKEALPEFEPQNGEEKR
jgi:hypothetical protein